MRLIGHIDNERHARAFTDFLCVRGIATEFDREAEGNWSIWIVEEEQVAGGKQMFERFCQAPDAAEFQGHEQAAAELRRMELAADLAVKRRTFDRRQLFPNLGGYGVGPLTFLLICVCILVAAISGMGRDAERLHSLFITEIQHTGHFVSWNAGLPEIRDGELWRLFTPAVMHFGALHLLGNLSWIFSLGSLIEARQGSGRLASLVLIVAVVSNLAQYFMSGPAFGGMSGVVYGLFGYAWMRGKFDPASGLKLDQQTIVISLVWFALCFTGWVGPIANTVHATGLAVGVAWGWLSAWHAKRRR